MIKEWGCELGGVYYVVHPVVGMRTSLRRTLLCRIKQHSTTSDTYDKGHLQFFKDESVRLLFFAEISSHPSVISQWSDPDIKRGGIWMPI